MIALMFLAGIAVWLIVVIVLTVWIPRILSPGWPRTVARLILFPVLLVLPIADQWIGNKQFKELCERENIIHLSDDWKNVKRARNISPDYHEKLNGYFINIIKQEVVSEDIDTGKVFLRYNGYHAKGGFLMGRLGFGLGGAITCWPENDNQILNQINIDQLIKNGNEK